MYRIHTICALLSLCFNVRVLLHSITLSIVIYALQHEVQMPSQVCRNKSVSHTTKNELAQHGAIQIGFCFPTQKKKKYIISNRCIPNVDTLVLCMVCVSRKNSYCNDTESDCSFNRKKALSFLHH